VSVFKQKAQALNVARLLQDARGLFGLATFNWPYHVLSSEESFLDNRVFLKIQHGFEERQEVGGTKSPVAATQWSLKEANVRMRLHPCISAALTWEIQFRIAGV
jgi:hypothetical protein